eukprot:CAMPEP_0113945502 /NCGR_PEP_ID=MMETSP1339-20121228/46939_1 /TAXON_ID=94617 /ORGANISM="Fibrocapsa japonica" /LENGTH=179 /DNA_ID=CAMNT_0000951119 /DNA_START=147 /DNA_END=683 /DNA_ORIENTATION=- /assembly_acc=CAM_ASM_000762
MSVLNKVQGHTYAESTAKLTAAYRNSSPVQLRIYDIGTSVKPFCSWLLNKRVDAMWHCGVFAFGKEYWFSHDIDCKESSITEHALDISPKFVLDLGDTLVNEKQFAKHLTNLSSKYNGNTYNVFDRNCNHFAEEICQFLAKKSIPEELFEMTNNNLPEATPEVREKINKEMSKMFYIAW